MKKNLKIYIAVLISFLLFCMLYIILYTSRDIIRKNEQESKELNVNYSSIYSWHIEDIENDLELFDTIIDEYNVERLYQSFSDDYLKGKDNTLLTALEDLNIDTYYLTGDSSWGQKNGRQQILNSIDKVINYNNNNEYNIRGLLLDIEPYTNSKIEEFSSKEFKVYVNELEKIMDYAHQNNLKIIVAIPYWYDSIDMECLTKLVKMVDGISVMNYHIDDTIGDIETEFELASKDHKIIDSVYMVKYDDSKYFSSYQEIYDDYHKLKSHFGYNKYLYMSLHDYKSIVKYRDDD